VGCGVWGIGGKIPRADETSSAKVSNKSARAVEPSGIELMSMGSCASNAISAGIVNTQSATEAAPLEDVRFTGQVAHDTLVSFKYVPGPQMQFGATPCPGRHAHAETFALPRGVVATPSHRSQSPAEAFRA